MSTLSGKPDALSMLPLEPTGSRTKVRDDTGGGHLLPRITVQPNSMQNLRKLRQQIRAQRRALTAKQQKLHSQNIAKRLINSTLFLRSKRIAFYLSEDGEVDLTPILNRAHQMGKECFLPVIHKGPKYTLWFCKYQPGDKLIPNHFGINEPDHLKHLPVKPWGLDLILMPLVAFDIQRNRLGMGGGYYDRTLNFLRTRSYWHSPYLVGIAHECQKVDQLPIRHWDIPLQGVVTENSFYR